ncbi:DNA repair protein complementing XP-G cells-like [Anneissia japonica]|uniref:DNA repair protein complementing XP-G cells-like n=1 Tax=Anneissia japonica TaxID=1529436 RepID=UPI001425B239|nr:DNA repair protein complementing XP-G cells-like [Anneissia japonica]XP_033110315.1 DNA repair protein complementing XP-G cells-like [Anneissia japonica]
MGVHGLWQLLKPTGKPVTLESLEGKVLAVDISIWLHQAVRGMRDAEGNLVSNAHLVTLLHRICKLLYFRIKPIFVFDGSVPELKRQTMAARRKKKEFAIDKSEKATEQILRNYMKVHAVDTVLGKKKSVKKPRAPRVSTKADAAPNMYILPPLPASTQESLKREEEEEKEEDEHTLEQHQQRSFLADHYQKIGSIDIQSEDFKSLPPEVQHELIEEFLERNKHNAWAKKKILPKEANEFSEFQLSKLLNKNKLNQRLEDIREEMSKRSSGEIASILDVETKSVEAKRIVSEDTQHYILVKTQKQTTPQKEVEDEYKPSGSKDIIEVEDIEGGSKSVWNTDNVDVTDKEKSKGSITAEELERAMQAVFNNQKTKMSKKNLASDFSKTSDNDVIKTVPEETIPKTPSAYLVSSNSGLDISKPENNLNIDVRVTDSPEDMANNESQISKNSAFTSISQNINVVDLTEDIPAQEKIDDQVIMVTDNPEGRADKECQISKNSVSQSVGQIIKVVDLTEEIPAQDKIDDQAKFDRADIKVIKNSSHTGSFVAQEKNQQLEVENQPTSVIENNHVENIPTVYEREFHRKTIDLQKEDEVRDETEKQSIEVNEEEPGSESEDDFLEVSFDPTQVSGNDELFPAEIFIQSNHVSDEAARQDHITSNEDEITEPDIKQIDREEIAKLQHEEEENMASLSKEREKSIKEWKDMNMSDVSEMENALAQERITLQTEQKRQQRIGASITDQMYAESKELLELFGIPYVVSPQEAEAQCAFLDLSNQTYGSITDDSDVWLFGGQRVYKNFFTKDKDVEFYESSNFETQLFLDRMKLINLALLLGCDYSDGIDGVGCITAMEILSEFPGSGIDGLKNFKAWWDKNVGNLNPPVETKIKSKLRKLDVPTAFPQEAVVRAFMSPQVEESAEEFTWGIPDLDSIRGFALERLSWNTKKTDENVLPILKRLNEKSVQRPITSFFSHVAGHQTGVKSKRLKRVLKKLGQSQSDTDEEEKIPKNKKTKQRIVDQKEAQTKRKRKAAEDNVQKGKEKKSRQSKQKMGPTGDAKSKSNCRGTKAKIYTEESDSDEINADRKFKMKGPVLSESGSSTD